MPQVKIQIIKISDISSCPGRVECILNDAWGNQHTFNEKIPIVTSHKIDTSSEFPQDGVIRCEVLMEWRNEEGKKIITVTTENPDHVETISGIFEFDLFSDQVLDTW